MDTKTTNDIKNSDLTEETNLNAIASIINNISMNNQLDSTSELHITANPTDSILELHITDDPTDPILELHITDDPTDSILELPITDNPTNPILELPIVESCPQYENLVLSGGSTRGIAHIGAISKLIDAQLLDLTKIKGLASTSAGSMLGMLIVLGFTIDQIWEFILSIDFEKLISPNFFLFAGKCGIESGQIFYNIIEGILSKTTGINNINFEQLYEITKISYTVVGSCLTAKKAVYFNHINTPKFRVSVALRISMSIPGFFTPVVIDNKTYIDGSIIDNYPIELFHDKLDKTIGIIICNEYDTDYKYPEEYCMSIINLFMHICYKKDETKYKENTIYINKNITKMSMFDFKLDINKKKEIYQSGVLATEEFILCNINK